MLNMRRKLLKAKTLGLALLAMAASPLLPQAPRPDNFVASGAKVSLPSSWKFTVQDGRVFSSAAITFGTNAELDIPILRCVTSHHPDDPFPAQAGTTGQTYLQKAIGDGGVTPQCQVTLFIFMERLPGCPDGKVTLKDLEFNNSVLGSKDSPFTLNGRQAGLLSTPLATGAHADAGNPAMWNKIQFTRNSQDVKFGSPNYSPDTLADDLYKFSKNLQSIAPTPGLNQIYLRSASAPSSGSIAMKYRIHLSGMIEFGAMAPIILVHGTNADHTTWEEPKDNAYEKSLLTAGNGAWQLDNSRIVDPNCPSCGLNGQYAGPWFYKIDLGPAALLPMDMVTRAGYDRYINEVPDLLHDAHGNASNKFSAEQLRVLIPLVLEMYGMNDDNWAHAQCHLVAHSKGGSDCRYLVTKYLSVMPKDPGTKPFKVLGFFSLATPFRGTPVSDIAYTLGNSPMNVPVVSGGGSPIVVQSIQAAVNSVVITVDLYKSPTGAALKDQRYFLGQGGDGSASRNIAIADWKDFILNRGQYFAQAADADIDGDGQISGEEAKVLNNLALPINGLGFTSVYQLLATVQGNLQLQCKYIPNERNDDVKTLIVMAGSPFGTWMPNDLVTPYSSAFPKELEGSRFSRKGFRHDFLAHFIGKRQLRGVDPPDLDPGNHSMQKNPAVITGIINTMLGLYPPTYPGK